MRNDTIFVAPSFQKVPYSNCFPFTRKRKLAFSNNSGLKSFFVKFRLPDGLMWTLGLTVEIKLRSQISPAWCEPGARLLVQSFVLTELNLLEN